MTASAGLRRRIPRLEDDYSPAAATRRADFLREAACAWIRAHYPGVRHFCLESNLATDKKSSQVNILATRGKRVTAEATIPPGWP
jgi:Hydroxymethylglutaryl-coenzyme A reductase